MRTHLVRMRSNETLQKVLASTFFKKYFCDSRKVKFLKRRDMNTDGRSVGETIDPEIQ